MTQFTIGDSDFELDGRPHRVLAGALHYFRVHPEQWADRIRKARLMGLNTIETYVAWNFHEPTRGEWDATGSRDLGRFLDLVAAEGMHAIVRPGPYICAEWHNGGLPAWLTAMEGIGLRRSEPRYLAELTTYLRRVYEIVAPRQIDRGGPVVLVQIENEYGAYGDDKEYLRELVRVTRDAGITVPLTTIDQPTDQMLSDGSLEGLHMTGSFGSRAAERLATLRAHQKTGPLMCAEFWDGWFDWVGSVHHTTSVETAAAELDALLAAGASVNFYMFHGGTNFGLTNGANHKGRYLPIVTSYDYDAPLDEAGSPTAKYFAFREVLSRYTEVPDEVPSAAGPAPVFDVALSPVSHGTDWRGADAFAWADAMTTASWTTPPTFEQLEHTSALVRYDAELPDVAGASAVFEVDEVRDRAWVSVDGVRVGTLDRGRHERALVIPRGRRISVLVEEQGRVNYDVRLGENKGMIGTPRVDRVAVEGWTATPIDVEQWAREVVASAVPAPAVSDNEGVGGAEGRWAPVAGPVGLTASFTLDQPADLFLDTSGWGRGFAVINGFLLGRYSQVGPQRTLFVPSPVVRAGENTLVVLELEQMVAPLARFVDALDLGPLEE